MAMSQELPGVAAMGGRADAALRLPVGIASPLWALFGAAASAGVAYWWATRWTRAANFEALASLSLAPQRIAPEVTRIEITAEPAPAEVVEAAFVELEAAVVVAEPPALAAAEPATVVEAATPAEILADDLTLMTGIGPKLAAALAERGVTRFAQIAAWTGEDVAEMDAALSLKGRAVREAWVAQAKRLAGAH